MTNLDDFFNELEVLLKKYDYILTSVEEHITQDCEQLRSLHSPVPFLLPGFRMINLDVRAMRVQPYESTDDVRASDDVDR